MITKAETEAEQKYVRMTLKVNVLQDVNCGAYQIGFKLHKGDFLPEEKRGQIRHFSKV